ncbi:hypothetical protein DFJ74DRAFT_695520 [Hyaloraphidium curvatum]|nr:hypothetical protein DFJ74DRAFT_695520 [Hyaloraphidium curvatum]
MLLRLWAGTGLGTLAGCAKGILRPYLGPGSEYEVTLPRSVGTSLLEWDLQDAVVKGNVELARSLVARGVRTRVTSSLGLSGEEISPDMLEFLVANDLAAASLLLKLCVRQGLLALARRVIEANADRVDPFEVLPVAIPSVPPPAEKQDEVLELFKCALREVPAARYIASTLVSQAAQAGEEFKAALQEYLDEIEAQGLALPVTPMGMASAVQHFNFANY